MITDGCTILEKNDIVIYFFCTIYTYLCIAKNQRRYSRLCLWLVARCSCRACMLLTISTLPCIKISHQRLALLCIKQLKVVASCLSELYWTPHILRCEHCDVDAETIYLAVKVEQRLSQIFSCNHFAEPTRYYSHSSNHRYSRKVSRVVLLL